MPALQLAVHVGSLPLPLRQALPLAASWGVGAVQLAVGDELPLDLTSTGVRQIRKLLEDHNLRVAALTFSTRRTYYAPENLERRVQATKDALRLAHALGTDVVVNAIGRVPSDAESPEWRLLVEVLNDIGAQGGRAGARLAAETGTESGADLRRLLDALPEGFLGVTLDTGRLVMNGLDPLEMIAAVGRDLMHVQLRDALRDRSQLTGSETTLGRGSVDFPNVLAALEERDYRGWLSVVRDAADDPATELRRAVRYLREL